MRLNHDRLRQVRHLYDICYATFPESALYQYIFGCIITDLKNTQKSLTSLHSIRDAYNLPRNSFDRVRMRAKRLGLIDKVNGYWQFSNNFFTAIDKFKEAWIGMISDKSELSHNRELQDIEFLRVFAQSKDKKDAGKR